MSQVHLRREIVALLLIKAAALALLFFLFFSPAQRAHVDAQRVDDHITSGAAAP